MKTAVSVPDEIFREAETAARRLRVSRSELYTMAISEYLERAHDSEITQRLNEVYAECSSELDPELNHAQLKSLNRESW